MTSVSLPEEFDDEKEETFTDEDEDEFYDEYEDFDENEDLIERSIDAFYEP